MLLKARRPGSTHSPGHGSLVQELHPAGRFGEAAASVDPGCADQHCQCLQGEGGGGRGAFPPPPSPAPIPLEALNLNSCSCSCSRLGLWPGTRRAEPLGAAGRGPWGLRRSSPSTFLLLLQVERKRPPSTGSPESSQESKEKLLKGEGSLQRVQAIAGNVVCCDCGLADPRWASINLGITLCIECSGIHRWASGQQPLGPPSFPASFLNQCLLSAL